MLAIIENAFNLVQETFDERKHFEQVRAIVQSIGFDYCAYGLKTSIPVSRPKVVVMNSYPEPWNLHYMTSECFRVDPIVRHCLSSEEPIAWTAHGQFPEDKFWQDAVAHRVSSGWSQCIWDRYGSCSLFTVARDGPALDEREVEARLPMLTRLAYSMHANVGKRIVKRLMPEIDVDLSFREREIIKWSAEGKTSQDVGRILDITERTVNYHMANIVEKLGASNRAHAAIRAVLLGLIC